MPLSYIYEESFSDEGWFGDAVVEAWFDEELIASGGAEPLAVVPLRMMMGMGI